MILRMFAVLSLTALPATAEVVCKPPPGAALVVGGTEPTRMREGPDKSWPVVGKIAPGEAGVIATGDAKQTKGPCVDACRAAADGQTEKEAKALKSCKSKGQLWYQVRRADGTAGWSPTTTLELAGN